MNWLPILPSITCMFTIMMTSMFSRQLKLQRMLHAVGLVVLMLVSILLFIEVMQKGEVVTQVGNYAAPYGITFIVDRLSAMLLLVTGLVAFCVGLYSLGEIDENVQKYGFYIVYWVLLLGICGAFATGDLFNLYVWFEVMLIASFVLLVLGNSKAQLDGAMKYVSLNLIATILMLLAIAMLYGMTGTLNMADLSVQLKAYPFSGTTTTVVVLLVVAFAIKSALFPLFFWLPASYHTTNISTAAIFAGMLTKVGVYALIRLTTLILTNDQIILALLVFLASMTMITGVLGAVSQFNFRRLLSFHIISQIGYIVMGLAIYTPFALTAALFYMVHHIIVKTNLFLISGVCTRVGDSNDIRRLGGFYQYSPLLALLFFISAFSLAGIPPLSGFWGKLMILQSAIGSSHYWAAAITLMVSLLTLFSMTKLWNYVFWKDVAARSSDELLVNLNYFGASQKYYISMLPIIILASMTLIISIFPQMLFNVVSQTSEQLFHPEAYIQAVMGARIR